MASRFVDQTDSSDRNWIYMYDEDNDKDIEQLYDEIKTHYDLDQLDKALALNSNTNHGDDPELLIKKAVDEITPNTTTSCTNCSNEIIIEDTSQFEIGQHLSMPGAIRKLGKFYKHHAIVKGINATSTMVAELELIHFQNVDNKIKVVATKEEYDLRKNDIYYIKYEHPRYKPEVVVTRAEKILKESMEEDSPFKSYNLLYCNCEHFATWCVVGKSESLQVKGRWQQIMDALNTIFGVGSTLTTYLTRLACNSAYDIANCLQAFIGTACGIILDTMSGMYLLYCIVMTMSHIKSFKQGNMCRPCLKTKLDDLWLKVSLVGITIGISYAISIFVFPLVGPLVMIPLGLLVVLLSTALLITIQKLHSYLQSPFKADKMKISTLSEVRVGDIISFYYLTLKHRGIVTEVNEHDHKVKCVHYAWPEKHKARVVLEETFDLDPSKNTVQIYNCSPHQSRPPHKVIELARKRVGERKWWWSDNRSDHLCYWAKFKKNGRGHNDIEDDMDQLTTKNLKSAFIREEYVHLMSDIELGDVVKYESKEGIVVSIESLDDNYGREFELKMVQCNSKIYFTASHIIDLHKTKLKVIIYQPAHCFSMLKRKERALDLVERKVKTKKFNRRQEFFSFCIMRN